MESFEKDFPNPLQETGKRSYSGLHEHTTKYFYFLWLVFFANLSTPNVKCCEINCLFSHKIPFEETKGNSNKISFEAVVELQIYVKLPLGMQKIIYFEVISKKRYATGRKNFKNGGIAKWSKAVTEARKNLGITGFYAVKKGSALYKEARQIYDA